MSRWCLDTSAYSRFRRESEEVVDLLDRAEWIGLPTVVLGRRRDRNEAELHEFMAHPVVRVLTVDEEVSRHYARIVTELRSAGTPLPTNDIWIAATAARSGALVLTYDAHFRRISGVGARVLAD